MSALSQLLVIDDEPVIRQVLAAYLNDAGYAVEQAGNGAEALARLAQGDIDIAICDIKMPDITGIETLRRARAQNIDTAFIMMTAFASVNTAIEAMKAGAYDFIIKPLREDDVIHRIMQLERTLALKDENRLLRGMVLGDQKNFCVCPSAAMKEVERLVSKVAPTDNTVLITGESGTGKGMIARMIHRKSPRSGEPFLPVNCGAIPESLLESEFFGHVKGAFTGAAKAKKGLFAEAHGGTLFMDEIGELPLHLQVKLLNAIDEKKVRPVGSERERPVDVRLVVATNRDLAAMVGRREFREDLFFRVNVLNIHIPPLRERPEDIPPLIRFILRRENEKMPAAGELGMDADSEELLQAYGWPGNVREMENVISRAVTLAEGGRITISDLPAGITRIAASTVKPAVEASGSFRDQVRAFEINLIRKVIDDMGGDRRQAAGRLGIGLSTLYRKLEEMEK